MNSFGYTESHYKGPAGEGAGILLESVKKSPFYPDGYYLHRSFWIGSREASSKSDPARRDRVRAGAAGRGGEAVDDGPGPGVGAREEVLGAAAGARREGRQGRRAVRSAAGAGRPKAMRVALLETSKYMVDGKLIPKPLAWSQVHDAFALAAPLGARPRTTRPAASPTPRRSSAKDAKDLRGAPAWDMQQLERAHVIARSRLQRNARGTMIVGFIGLGTMGAPMARNLLDKGHRAHRVRRAAGRGRGRWSRPARRAAATPREVAAASEIVITMLPDAPDVERVALGADGIVAGIRAGAVYIDMSTIDPGDDAQGRRGDRGEGRGDDRQPGRQDRGCRGRRHADADGRRTRRRRRALPAACSTAWAPTSSTAASSAPGRR